MTFLFDLADRFRPIMLPLSSLYWFTEDERVILIFQAIIVAAAVFPIWLLAQRRLPRALALVVAFLYLDFIGVQSIVVADFHEMAILPFFLGWLFYFLARKRWRSYFIVLFLCLSVREHVGLMLATLSFFIFWTFRNFVVAFATFVISLAWSITAITFVMPSLGQNYYASFVETGDTFGRAVLGYLKNPLFAIESFFTPFEKVKTLFWSFFSFGFLPLFYIALAPTILFQFI